MLLLEGAPLHDQAEHVAGAERALGRAVMRHRNVKDDLICEVDLLELCSLNKRFCLGCKNLNVSILFQQYTFYFKSACIIHFALILWCRPQNFTAL